MKKLVFLFVSVLALGLTSCSEDDGTTDEGIDSNASIEGKWIYSKEGGVVEGTEQFIDYEHAEGCDQDYIEIFEDGDVQDVWFEGDDCQQTMIQGDWSRSGNNVTLIFNGQTFDAEILTLTNSTLKIKYTEDDFTYLTVYTRG